MAGWALGTFGVVGWPVGREGEGLDVLAIDFGRRPVIMALADGPSGRYIVARVPGHSTFATVGSQRYEPQRLYLIAVGREPRADYPHPVYEATIVTSIAAGRQARHVALALAICAQGLSVHEESEAEARARWNSQAVARAVSE